MEKQDSKEQGRLDGLVELNESNTTTRRSSGGSGGGGHSVSFLHGSNSSSNGNIAAPSGSTFGTYLPFDLSRQSMTTTGDQRGNININNSNNVQHHGSSATYATAANSNYPYRRRSTVSSSSSAAAGGSPYSGPSLSHEALPPVDHHAADQRSKGSAYSMPKAFLFGSTSSQAQAPSAEVRHLLFQGHENEHMAASLLHPNIGSNVSPQWRQNHDNLLVGQLPPRPHLVDLRTSCIYCYQNISTGNTTVSKRSCGHYFHNNCFHLQSESMKGQHIWITDCHFCQLEKH
ncbi:GATA zinc finger domain-containing protein 7-like isoform X2 [Macadamia integrifolia]|uniref:GATA zinc finger domain-containing protein 7-like isoform X2 n=1 Tax=Macadamia integrifolia TaxID=60698 RepID=UPI001C4E9456|nr:GATA zinc finger domain-containing protein 7-like isoform X2 [Macadamia integrifolia]